MTSEGLGRALDLESEVDAPIRNTAIERESMKKATREGGFAFSQSITPVLPGHAFRRRRGA